MILSFIHLIGYFITFKKVLFSFKNIHTVHHDQIVSINVIREISTRFPTFISDQVVVCDRCLVIADFEGLDYMADYTIGSEMCRTGVGVRKLCQNRSIPPHREPVIFHYKFNFEIVSWLTADLIKSHSTLPDTSLFVVDLSEAFSIVNSIAN